MGVPITTYISYAKVGQCSLADKYAKDAIFRGINLVPDYVSLLRVIRETVQNQYALTGETVALDGLANYMYALSGSWDTTVSNPITEFIIVVQPSSQTVNSGSSVTFSVVVAGGTSPYSYQWRKNGTNIGGATSSTYTINPVGSGDAANYDCVITDSSSTPLQLTSDAATLTVNAAAITGSAWFGDTDYFSTLSGGTDNVPYQLTFNITHDQPLVIPYTMSAGNNKMLVIRVPRTESLKSNWANTAFNYGTIQPPDGTFRAPLQPVGLPNYTYYLTEIASSFDFNSPNTLTLS